MTDELRPFYESELSFIRRMGAQFAKAYPKIAGRLTLKEGETKDPHVERMIEAFAYLNARTRHKLEDEFPELTEALLGILYPHYQAPIPSLAIVEFHLDPEQQVTSGHTIPRGSPLESEPYQDQTCRFQTCYPVTLWPIAVETASLNKPPFKAPNTPNCASAKAVMRLSLRCHDERMTFAELTLPALRFFLKGQPQHVYRLYELILNNTLEIALANRPDDEEPVLLDKSCLRPVGFEPEEGLLPYSPRSFVGYRLLTEFFAFPEKFLFFELARLDTGVLKRIGNQLEIFLYLNRTASELERTVAADLFRLGCTPIVNLYRQPADPIQLKQTEFEYRVVPDARRPRAHEIYSIEKVTATDPDGKAAEFAPFFSLKHAAVEDATPLFWHQSRRPSEHTGEADADLGTEIFLSLVDLSFQPNAPANWTLGVETMCLNRDLPQNLPFGEGQPKLQLVEGGGLVSQIVCVTKPTPTLRPARRRGALWRLISHLSLNHLSLVGDGAGAEALREILSLYDFMDNAETQKMVSGILGVTSQRVVGRLRGSAQAAFCRGVEVNVRFDEARFAGSGLFLFASVLERFLALYCTVNSFTRMVATVQDASGVERELRRWQARIGEKVVV